LPDLQNGHKIYQIAIKYTKLLKMHLKLGLHEHTQKTDPFFASVKKKIRKFLSFWDGVQKYKKIRR
jgi:hypothetical protein